MIATKYPNYIQIEGLEEHSQAYDENSFILRRVNGSSVLFTLEIVSPTEVKLLLQEENNDKFMILITNINGVETSTILVRREEDTEQKPIIPEVPIEEENIKYYFNDDFMVIRKIGGNDSCIKSKDLIIEIKEYTLERYDDFYEESIMPVFNVDCQGNVIPDIEFKIKLDRIYRITITYKGKTTVDDYIHKTPTCYFSSIYHIKNLANNFDLIMPENNKTEFDLKLLIWKYSRMAVSIAGITGDVIYEHKNSLLNDYVGKKVFLDVITKAIRDTNINPDKAKETLGSIAVTLADLSHGATATETVTTQLLKVHKSLYQDIKDYEKQMRELFSYLQATESVDKKFKAPILKRVETFNPYIRRGRKYR